MAHLAPMQINKKRRVVLALPPPPTPSAKTLVKALVSLSKAVAASGKPRVCQNRNATNIVRRIELLTALFEEIRDSDRPVPPSVVIAFRDLHGLMQRVCLLLEECAEKSMFWLLMEQETYAQYFHELTQSLGSALKSIPLDLLDLSEEIMEQTVLVRAQVLRARLSLNPVELQLREDVIIMLKLVELKEAPYPSEFGRLFSSMQLLNATDCETEIHRLEEISMEEDRKEDLKTLQALASLINFVRYGKYVLYSGNFEDMEDDVSQARSRSGNQTGKDAEVPVLTPPTEFLCPITLDLMRDPVIVATGQTYDKSSITRWIQAGHSSCPKTGQKLAHNNLIPNYALRSLISQWCEDNNVPFENEGNSHKKKGSGIQHVHSTGASLEAMKLTAAFLIQKLATGNDQVKKQVARELRLLSKAGAENRICIAEAGGIPLLLPLLSSSDAKAQEHAVTTLLNLSIVDENKDKIVAADALDLIIEVLKAGHTMEARENAAAALFSLSVSDEVKVQIGSKFDAIPSLVTLLREGSVQRGKKDAATALFNLAVYHGNKGKIIAAGAVPSLVALLADDSPAVADACAAVLALLSTLPEGTDAIRDAAAISQLVSLLRHGTPKGREYAASVLLAMCRTREKAIIDEVFQHQNSIVPYLYNLLTTGTVRAKRKATSLLRLLRTLEPVETAQHHIPHTRTRHH
ncbi:hypothetical protein M758_7G084200 [Ceratodon purpureus]|uniref:U-box domain-containing protein 12 n=1 Tax=Ceratodon purpureus TaxID=3225 RepID=A0A8T0HCK7_CERPU|nr:hypothetical protein KC19_7G089400 [Ceratodon purpureus]KAG0610691.1 hypothetical protein M758_7G084200 [Ceratodon purpureus]